MQAEHDICVKTTTTKKKQRMLYNLHLYEFQQKQEGRTDHSRQTGLRLIVLHLFYESVSTAAETTETNFTIKTLLNTIKGDLTLLFILALSRMLKKSHLIVSFPFLFFKLNAFSVHAL